MANRREVQNLCSDSKPPSPQKWQDPNPPLTAARQYTEIAVVGTITGVAVKLMGNSTNEALAMGLLGGLITFYWTHSLQTMRQADIDAAVDHHAVGPPGKPDIKFGDPKNPLY
jgi:hypothetical protein